MLEVVGLGEFNTLTLALDQLQLAEFSELRIFSTDATGDTLAQIESFSLLQSDRLHESYAPAISLDTNNIEGGKFLQFQLVGNGTSQTAMLSSITDEQAQLTFDGGRVLTVSLDNRDSKTDLLTGDAEAIDLTGQSDTVTMNFSVYREAVSDNTVGFYRTEDAEGSVRDPYSVRAENGQQDYRSLCEGWQWPHCLVLWSESLPPTVISTLFYCPPPFLEQLNTGDRLQR